MPSVHEALASALDVTRAKCDGGHRIPSPGKIESRGSEFRVILNYRVNLRPAWTPRTYLKSKQIKTTVCVYPKDKFYGALSIQKLRRHCRWPIIAKETAVPGTRGKGLEPCCEASERMPSQAWRERMRQD